MCLFTIALEIAKAHHQDLQVVGPCQRSIQRECVSVLLYLYVIYISFHIHSLSSLNCCITSGSSRQEVMGQVLFSYINLTTVLWAVSSFFPQIFTTLQRNAMYGFSLYMAVPGRNRTLLYCVFRSHYCFWSAVTQYFCYEWGLYVLCKLDTFTRHMSPTLNGSYALQCFEHGNAIETCNRMMFDFYLVLPHIHLFTHSL